MCVPILAEFVIEAGTLVFALGDIDDDENQSLFLDADQRLSAGSPSAMSDGLACEGAFPQLFAGFVSDVANWITEGTQFSMSDLDSDLSALLPPEPDVTDPNYDPLDLTWLDDMPDPELIADTLLAGTLPYLTAMAEVSRSLDVVEETVPTMARWIEGLAP